MERFRAHEKEFKKKQFSKKALLSGNNGDRNQQNSDDSDYDPDGDDSDYGDGDDDDQDDDNDDGDEDEPYVEEFSEEKLNGMRLKDKEYLMEVQDFVKTQVAKLETDLETMRNKKVKGPPKKQKEKQGALSLKVSQAKKMRDRIEEIANSLEYVDPLTQTKNLKAMLAQFMMNPDDDSTNSKTQQLETEFNKLLEIVETNKKVQMNNLQIQKDQ